jgi:hypothetical protein
MRDGSTPSYPFVVYHSFCLKPGWQLGGAVPGFKSLRLANVFGHYTSSESGPSDGCDENAQGEPQSVKECGFSASVFSDEHGEFGMQIEWALGKATEVVKFQPVHAQKIVWLAHSACAF